MFKKGQHELFLLNEIKRVKISMSQITLSIFLNNIKKITKLKTTGICTPGTLKGNYITENEQDCFPRWKSY